MDVLQCTTSPYPTPILWAPLSLRSCAYGARLGPLQTQILDPALAERGYATACRPSVRPSICVSVRLRRSGMFFTHCGLEYFEKLFRG